MQSKVETPDEYISSLPDYRKDAVARLRKIIKKNLPKGFKETMGYGMIGWVVPHTIFPAGYHCDPKMPLPFLSLASQKNYIAVYHMGLYSDPKLLKWFQDEWKKFSSKKLDMGKSCLRFKKAEDVPFDLIGQLASKITPKQWIKTYESAIAPRKPA
ncbi:MAG: DUF1801 domain-containing protein [Pyrinomonadaceae bacterium]